MKIASFIHFRYLLSALLLLFFTASGASAKDLASWENTASKQAIVDFVKKTTKKSSPDFVPEAERIAVFDNDGTLWAEQPIYFQAAFAFDRIKQMAPQHPEWNTTEPYASVIKGDIKGALAGGMPALSKIIMASHGNISSDDFSAAVSNWLATAKHPTTGLPYNKMIYQPMLELLQYLRKNGYKTFIVSGGGIDFMRVFAQDAYGIPPEQVVGSSLQAKYSVVNGVPTITKAPDLGFYDDKEGKPVGIYQHIGRRPVFAAGNSDGDYQMLEWTTAGTGARFGLIVHHTDAEREWAYDRNSHIGELNKGLTDAPTKGWLLVDMKKDWKVIYPASKK
ncbi:HAD family hydrolase [Cellvibrio sp. NN19]|uniref:HAD family hydrolase n=1 Tax=Cellvibrio chitinivorans TaxID=3102792 RepID=UPI002B411346|nr:HAD family hydrolase [Cellvibrio sp. NN19]